MFDKGGNASGWRRECHDTSVHSARDESVALLKGDQHMMRDLAVVTVLFLHLAGCGTLGSQQADRRPVPEIDLARMMSVADSFWHAAAEKDSAQMAAVSAGLRAITWARGKEDAFPAFFRVTDNHLKPQHGYFVSARRDTAVTEVEVPWQTCRPPYHTGGNDHYFLMMVPARGQWRIANIWSDPC